MNKVFKELGQLNSTYSALSKIVMMNYTQNDEISIKSLKESIPELQKCFEKVIGASYNIKRLFNIMTKKQINWDDVYKVMDILTAPSSNLICNRGIFTNEQNSI